MRNNNQLLNGDETRCKENILHGRQRMLTHDLFAVANLVVQLHCRIYSKLRGW